MQTYLTKQAHGQLYAQLSLARHAVSALEGHDNL
jgi:hypothetical protein